MNNQANIVSAADIYGGNAENILGVQTETTAINASGAKENVSTSKNNTGVWLGMVILLVVARVFEEMLPTA